MIVFHQQFSHFLFYFNNHEIWCLLYADDIILMSKSDEFCRPCLILSVNGVINGDCE